MLVIGLWTAATGVVEIVSAVRLRREIADEWLLGLSGIVSIILGAILISRPQFGRVTTTYVLGTYGLIFGVVLVVLGLRLRRLSSGVCRSEVMRTAAAAKRQSPPGSQQFPFARPSTDFTQRTLDSIARAGCGQ